MIDEGKPIFVQIAEQIENDIVDGIYPPEGQVPSTNEFAVFSRINPATAGKGVNRFVRSTGRSRAPDRSALTVFSR